MLKRLGILLLVLAVTGCGSGRTAPSAGSALAKTYPAHTHPVRMVRGELPPGAKFEILTALKVTKGWFGGVGYAEQLLADQARSIGADAVIKMALWQSPSGPALVAPHGSGTAVKILDPQSVDLEAVPGEWF